MVVYKPERTRTAQGELRMVSLLEAAEKVFGEIGYHAATTNAIAKEAQVSPATLYQFFPNKESIAEALTLRYADRLAEAHRAAGLEVLAEVSVKQLVSRMVDPLIEFHSRYPAFRTLLTEAPASTATARKHDLAAANNEAVAQLFMMRNAKLGHDKALLAAEACLAVFVGFLPLIAGSSGKNREKYVETLKEVLFRFLKATI